MPSDEQRVRTMAGWIGVEISRSRVRTPGKPGYGLYRVRGSVATRPMAGWRPSEWQGSEPTEWTAYAFTLGEIERAVQYAIGCGTPAAPRELALPPRPPYMITTMAIVPTRWTATYRGRRDGGSQSGRTPVVGAPSERSTVRSRQRAANAAFQAEHLERRAHGLKQRHADKTRRNSRRQGPGMAPM